MDFHFGHPFLSLKFTFGILEYFLKQKVKNIFWEVKAYGGLS